MSKLTEKLDGIAEMIRPMYPDAADWVEVAAVELRAGDGFVRAVPEVIEQARMAPGLESENSRLRAAIENAPHAPECEQWDLQTQTGRPLTDVCSCWKADAL